MMVIDPETHELRPYLKGHKRGFRKLEVTDGSILLGKFINAVGMSLDEIGFFNFGPLTDDTYVHHMVLSVPTSNFDNRNVEEYEYKNGKQVCKWTEKNIYADKDSWLWVYGDSKLNYAKEEVTLELGPLEEENPDIELSIDAVEPSETEALDGGETITITGTGFLERVEVKLGSKNAKQVKIESDTKLTAKLPRPTDGVKKVDVEVINPDGRNIKLKKGFNYKNVKEIKKLGIGTREVEGEDVKYEFTEEAVIAVWRDKGMTSLNKNKQSPGHASLKLKRRNNDSGAVEVVDYVSWWPEKSSDKKTKIQPGRVSSKYRHDQSGEVGADKHTPVFLSYMWETLHDPELDDELKAKFDQLFKDTAKSIWDTMEKVKNQSLVESEKKRAKEMLDQWEKEFGKEFKNFKDKEKNYRMRSNQKLNKKLKEAIEKTIKTAKGMKKDSTRSEKDIDIFLRPIATDTTNKLAMEGFKTVGKRPDEKIYIPCSCLPGNPENTKSVTWGLSLDSIRNAWLIFSKNKNQQYLMKSKKLNCSAAVWNTLKAGYGDLFVKFKTKNPFVGMVSYVPTDLIVVGETLHKTLGKLNEQQETLNKWAIAAKAEIKEKIDDRKIQVDESNTNINWKRIFEPTVWKSMSAVRRRKRWRISSIDKGINNYKKLKDELKPEDEKKKADDLEKKRKQNEENEKKLEKNIPQLENHKLNKTKKEKMVTIYEKKDQSIARNQRILKKFKEQVEDFDKKIKELEEENKKLQEDINKFSVEYKKEGNMIYSHRRKCAKELISLFKNVYKYSTYFKGDVKKNKRLPAVLLLGQCVALEFSEKSHYGINIPPLAFDNNGNQIFIPKYDQIS